jgi:hypothetical protein
MPGKIKPLTVKDVRSHLSFLGLSLRKSDNEYRVNFHRGEEATAYYTTDLLDALDTGVAMDKERLACRS